MFCAADAPVPVDGHGRDGQVCPLQPDCKAAFMQLPTTKTKGRRPAHEEQ
jgi:hypothetical protein